MGAVFGKLRVYENDGQLKRIKTLRLLVVRIAQADHQADRGID
jgi:hypothetical protein